MGALGAAAGAFEGDNAREEQSARRAGLGLQAAQLAQQDRQFAATFERQQANDVEGARRFDANREDATAQTLLGQQNADRGFGLQESKLNQDVQSNAFEQQRAVKQDAWADVLNQQKADEQKLKIEQNRATLDTFNQAAQKEREQLENRKSFAKTSIGALALSAMKNGGIASTSALKLFNEQQSQQGTGIHITSGFWHDNGFNFKRLGPGKDQNGNIVQGQQAEYDEVLNTAIATALFRDEFGEDAAKDQSANQRDNARYNSQLERDTLKAGNITDPMKKIRYTALQAEHRDAMRALLKTDKELDPEGFKAAEAAASSIEQHMAALDGGTNPVAGNGPGAGGLSFVRQSLDASAQAGTKYGIAKVANGVESTGAPDMAFLKQTKLDAIAAHPGDEAKQLAYFKGELAKSKQGGDVVERTLKNGQKVLVRQLANGKWEPATQGVEPTPSVGTPSSGGNNEPTDALYQNNTVLSDADEKAYRKWSMKTRYGLERQYDMRGVWAAGHDPVDKNGNFAPEVLDQFSKQKQAAPADSVTIRAPDGKTGTVKKEAADKYLQQPGFSVVGESQQESGAWRGTASSARRTPLIETNMNSQQTKGNNTLSSSASRLPKKQDETLTAEDDKALQAIHAESFRSPIDPVTKLPIDPAIYRKQKTREYFENKKRRDEEQFSRMYGEYLKR